MVTKAYPRRQLSIASSPPPRSGLRLEDQKRFQETVLRALGAGALAALSVWTLWAVFALAAAHLDGTWISAVGATVVATDRMGGLLAGGAGLGAGSIPLFPVICLFVALMAARNFLTAREEGKLPFIREVGSSRVSSEPEVDKKRTARERHAPMAPGMVPISPIVCYLSCALAGTLAGLLPWLLPAHPAFGIFSGGAIVGFLLLRIPVEGTGPRAKRLAIFLSGTSALVGVATIEALASHGWLDAVLPAPVPFMMHGAGLAGFIVLGTATGHLSVPTDQVKTSYRRTIGNLQGDLFAISRRAHEIFRATEQLLFSRAGNRAEALRLRDRLASVTCGVLDLSLRCQALDEATCEETHQQLATDIAQLEKSIDSATDDLARRQYERAREALQTQHALIERLRMGRERAVATMHNQLAHLERTRLSLIGLESSDSGRLMAKLGVLSESLEQASGAMDEETSAMLDMPLEERIETKIQSTSRPSNQA